MIREWVTVVKWHKGIATLRFNRQAMCHACHDNRGCGIKALNGLLPHLQDNELKIAIREPLIVGQQIELGIDESGLIKSALLVYCLPLFFLFFGIFIIHYSLPNNNFYILAGMLVGMMIGFIIAKRWAKRLENKGRYKPVILTIKPISK